MFKGLGQLGDMAKLMKQAQEMQKKMSDTQNELENIEVIGESGGGLVKVVSSAKGNFKKIELDKSLLVPSEKEVIEDLIDKKKNDFECFIANDNSNGQIVLSGTTSNIEKISEYLNSIKIKNIKLPVSAPFHCELMRAATEVMRNELAKISFKEFQTSLISNVTALEISDKLLIQDLLVRQIESRVRWRESINYMIKKGVDNFIEIGPGKILSGLVKRIDKNVKVSAINTEEDINKIQI